jgi:hypothetical protein
VGEKSKAIVGKKAMTTTEGIFYMKAKAFDIAAGRESASGGRCEDTMFSTCEYMIYRWCR